MKKIIFIVLLVLSVQLSAIAQAFISPAQPVETGKTPGVKVKLLSAIGDTKTYVFVFSTGEEVRSDLNEFAQK